MSALLSDVLISNLLTVRGGDTGFPVQFVRECETGRLVIRGINEGGFSCVDIDLFDLVDWLVSICPNGIDKNAFTAAVAEYSG